MTDLTKVLGTDGKPWCWEDELAKKMKRLGTPEEQLRKAMTEHGIQPPDELIFDGELHRFSTNSKPGDTSGWYVIFPDGPVPAGRFGCWRSDESVRFQADLGSHLVVIEQMKISRMVEEARRKRQEHRETKQQDAALRADEIWASSAIASADHPYLQRKGIEPNGARTAPDGRLVVPIMVGDRITSLQHISADGAKRFMKGGAIKGGHWHIGSKGEGTLYICEGFATGASIHQETGADVVISYSAGNLPAVAESMRERYSRRAITIVGDNDESGTGQKYAEAAGAATSARVIIPPTVGDANDYQQSGGDLAGLLEGRSQQWAIPASDFLDLSMSVRWLIKGWLPQRSMAMIHGPSGAGKTFLALDWALSVATGQDDWCGGRIREARPVLYLCGEGHAGLAMRLKAWMTARHVRDLGGLFVSRSACNLNQADGLGMVLDAARSMPDAPSLVVVDTLHRFFDGDENSARDARTMLDSCGQLIDELGCTVLLIHHTGVSDEAQHRARGSSAWKGALDSEVNVRYDSSGGRQVIQVKGKDYMPPEPVGFDIDQVMIPGAFDEDGEAISSAVFSHMEAPPEQEEDPKIRQAKRKFEAAWAAGEKELDEDGNPVIGSQDLINQLSATLEISKETARAYTQKKGRLMNQLEAHEIVSRKGEIWTVICPDFSAQIRLFSG